MDKLNRIIAKMALDEKASALCLDMYNTKTEANKRLGIDGLEFEYSAHGLCKYDSDTGECFQATCFPEPAALGRSWNRDCVRQAAQAIAEEAREQHVSAVFAPTLNVKRSLRAGGGFRCFSEDPYVCAELGVSFVKGLNTRGIGACLKYCGASAGEKNFLLADNAVDERALREIYLFAFEQVVTKCLPWGVMMTNDKINGQYTCESRYLMNELLRDEWNFKGLIFSDICSAANASQSLSAGLDIFVSSVKKRDARRIINAIKSGMLDESIVDECVRRLFEIILKAKEACKVKYLCDYQANNIAAKFIADECSVLLKNDNYALPLNKNDRVVVIGSDLHMQAVSRESVRPICESSLYEEMLRVNANTHFAAGYSQDASETNNQLKYEAMKLCEKADKIVFVAGSEVSSEECARKELTLTKPQLTLLNDIRNMNKPIILVITGEPVLMTRGTTADAVLLCGYLGQGGGRSVCDILYGRVNPSGKLSETIPQQEKDMPDFLYHDNDGNNVLYPESIYVGYRYYKKAKKEAAYPFGFGLSYTAFEYSNMTVSAENQNYVVSVDVKNTGKIAGKETVQVYVRECSPKIFKAECELKGFDKIRLEPQETKTVKIKLDSESFMFFDVQTHAWNASPGKYDICVGSSSENFLFTKTVEIFCGSVTRPVHDAKVFPHYNHIERAIFTVPHMEYEDLLGYKIKKSETDTFTMQSTLGQIKSTKIGKDIYRLTIGAIGNSRFVTNPDDVPLEKLELLSRGSFSNAMAQAALKVLNNNKSAYKEFKAACNANKKDII